MEVILLEKIARLGGMGDVVKVKDGYARNFLLPRKKALRATDANRAVFEVKRAEIEAANAESRGVAEKLAEKLKGVSISLIRQASEDGRLYGSVTTRDITDQLKEKGFDIDRKTVDLSNPIKTTGAYTVYLQLHGEVRVGIPTQVARTESEAEAAISAAELLEKPEAAPVEEAAPAEEAASAADSSDEAAE